MHAVLIHETGGPDVLSFEEIEPPKPKEGEVLIRVHAASVNPIDWKQRRGLRPKQLPAVLGRDISGTIELSEVEGFAAGEEVFGVASSGGYAEFASTSAELIAKKPAGMTHEQAAAIPVAGLTAWQALFDRGGLKRGQTALVAGAAGGVGHFAVQFAKHVQARVLGSGSTHNRDFVLSLGADEYIDYTQQDLGLANDVDVAFDTVGGATTATLLNTLRKGGVLVTIAGTAPEREAAERGMRAERLVMSPQSGQLREIAELVVAGEVKIEIARTLPLSEIQQAHSLSEAGHTRGKIVLSIST